MLDQIIVFLTIFITLILFVKSSLRFDLVAMLSLLFLVLTGIVPAGKAFDGFAHSAIITVAAVLVVSRGLINSGALNDLVIILNRTSKNNTMRLMGLMFLTAVLSSFMNNVGALALVMPIAIKMAKDNKTSSSLFLMPVAFSSLLGGMITEIGTPPNLIISMYRNQVGLKPFSFFDFAPVGLTITFIGLIYIGFIGWRFIPHRKPYESGEMLFKIEDYLSELLVPEGNKLIGKSLRELNIENGLEFNVLNIIRQKNYVLAPVAYEYLQAGDVLLVKTDPEELVGLLEKSGFILEGAKLSHDETGQLLNSDEFTLVETVIRDDSVLIGKTAIEMRLRNNYNMNLVAISRHGESLYSRLGEVAFKSGDVLLMLIASSSITDTLDSLRCLPLAERGITLGKMGTSDKKWVAIFVFGAGIALTTFGLLPVHIAFTLVAVTMVLMGLVTTKELYETIEWPIIIMLGAMLPLGEALQSTGGADTIAGLMLGMTGVSSPTVLTMMLMGVTMFLTNLINNSAAAVLMAPIAISMAGVMGISVDPLLMVVAVGASSAFLTPIGHQSNTLIMGPGGYKFGDYWLMGLPLSIIILLVGTPLILWIWPI
ncbi:MAG: SLC13 family permease [Clostridia bacterium]|nr:SLC13 family permease [Clostridia bacterium]